MKLADVIIVAGGLGTRFNAKVPKPLVRLKGKALITYSLKTFNQSPLINNIIVVGHEDYLKAYRNLAKPFKKVKAVVAGGDTRRQSVKCGLASVDPKASYVLVHDAARPFATASMINDLIKELRRYPAAIIAVPVKATVKQVNAKTKVVQSTLERQTLWEVQTPQAFRHAILVKAHAQSLKVEATDDAMLVEHLGLKVKVVNGEYSNIKITTPEDLHIARLLK